MKGIILTGLGIVPAIVGVKSLSNAAFGDPAYWIAYSIPWLVVGGALIYIGIKDIRKKRPTT